MRKCYCGIELDKEHKVYCSRLCQNIYQSKYKNGFKGKHHSEELRARWSNDRKKSYGLHLHKKDCICNFCKTVRHENILPMTIPSAKAKLPRGEKHHNWKGGVTSENEVIRKSPAYKKWRLSVFQRDGFTCVNCRYTGGRIEAHHIKSFADYPELRLELNNGVTLCEDCHEQIFAG